MEAAKDKRRMRTTEIMGDAADFHDLDNDGIDDDLE